MRVAGVRWPPVILAGGGGGREARQRRRVARAAQRDGGHAASSWGITSGPELGRRSSTSPGASVRVSGGDGSKTVTPPVRWLEGGPGALRDWMSSNGSCETPPETTVRCGGVRGEETTARRVEEKRRPIEVLGSGVDWMSNLMEEACKRSEGENAQLYLRAKADEEKYAYLTTEKVSSNLMHQSERLLKSERKAEYSWTPTFVAGSVWWVGMEKARRKTRNNPNFTLIEK